MNGKGKLIFFNNKSLNNYALSKSGFGRKISKHKGFCNLDSKNEWFLLLFSIPSAKPGRFESPIVKKVRRQRKPNMQLFGGRR